MVAISEVAKLATLVLLKTKIFSTKGYDVIIFAQPHQQNFTYSIELFCRCGHVSKVW